MAYLSKREQQIMDLVYQRERLTAVEAEELLPGRPTNSTVRTLLRILEQKGHLQHVEEEGRFVYRPVRPRQSAARQALDNLISTFYGGSVSEVVTALLTEDASKLNDDELTRLHELIARARDEGR